MERLVDIVKNNVAKMTHASAGVLYYKIETEKYVYIFPVDMNEKEEVGTGKFETEEKAIYLTRWFNKAVKNNSLISYEKRKEVK